MLRVLVPLVLLGLTVYTFVDCVQTAEAEQRHLPKPLWLLVILLLPAVGPIAWLVAGRPGSPIDATPPPSHSGRAPRGPDDDPDFLRRL